MNGKFPSSFLKKRSFEGTRKKHSNILIRGSPRGSQQFMSSQYILFSFRDPFVVENKKKLGPLSRALLRDCKRLPCTRSVKRSDCHRVAIPPSILSPQGFGSTHSICAHHILSSSETTGKMEFSAANVIIFFGRTLRRRSNSMQKMETSTGNLHHFYRSAFKYLSRTIHSYSNRKSLFLRMQIQVPLRKKYQNGGFQKNYPFVRYP